MIRIGKLAYAGRRDCSVSMTFFLRLSKYVFPFFWFNIFLKEIESLPQTLISNPYIFAPMPKSFNISIYECCQIKNCKLEITKIYIIRLQRYGDQKIFEFVTKTEFLCFCLGGDVTGRGCSTKDKVYYKVSFLF